MKFNKTLLGCVISTTLTLGMSAPASAVNVTSDEPTNSSLLKAKAAKKAASNYIVQLKSKSAISKAAELGELMPSNQVVGLGNRYNSETAAMQAYTATMKSHQKAVASDIGDIKIISSYVHTFNGFSAQLTPEQANSLKNHPDIAGVWEDQVFEPQTANTPEFLGITGPDGQHISDLKGEGIIVGILDTGITPENPSFADDLDESYTYPDPATLGWAGVCDAGVEAGAGIDGEDTFKCNNKLIGARYFSNNFASRTTIRTELGEILSPRDVDGHGSHVASTAAGNENVEAVMFGTPIGTMSGIAPRAQIAAYKVCWNSDYVNPETDEPERGCNFSDSMEAIDEAVSDGVDILNYSIGNSPDLTTPVYRAVLDANRAGVFFSASAGNEGDEGAQSVGNTAPWMTTVAASTYDGISATNVMEITSRDPAEKIDFLEGAITAPLAETGEKSGNLVIGVPLEGCFVDGVSAPLDNAEDIAGNIALIKRGSCTFSEKVERAQLAGATAVVIYSDNRPPTVLGGDGSYDIPGGMIANTEGQALADAITGGENVSVLLSAGAFRDKVEVGNIMADFSSLGSNPSTLDLLKPDITAPGVRILAATSSTPMFDVHGEQVKYLGGTSMSSPHIAGMAALLLSRNKDWTPAQVQSALMTTSRQNVVQPDGVTPATPFNYGAGHAQPIAALDPGLTYDAHYLDYMAFMCGIGNSDFVLAQTEATCADFVASGFNTTPNQLNYPSISIGELIEDSQTIFRTVTDMTGVGGTYTISVEAPAGVTVETHTFDQEGTETPEDGLVVPASGKATYALTFTRTEEAVINEWVFGSVTLSNGTYVVRSPIAVLPSPDIMIEAPAAANVSLRSGRGTMPVKMNYTGTTSMDYAGFVPAQTLSGIVGQDPDSSYNPGEPELVEFNISVPEGSKLLRLNLKDANIAAEGTDLDLFLFRCVEDTCNFVTASAAGGSNEDITLLNPAGGEYRLDVHGWNTAGVDAVAFDLNSWLATGPEATTRISMSRRAIKGRYNRVSIRTQGLEAGVEHLGAITFYDGEGATVQTTVLSTTPQ